MRKILLALAAALAKASNAAWTNTLVSRDIKVSSSAVLLTETIYTLKKAETGTPSFEFYVPAFDSVGSVKVVVLPDGINLKLGTDFRLESVSNNLGKYAIDSAVGLETGSRVKVSTASGAGLEPFPASGMELEAQKILISAPLIVVSPHSIEKQTTVVDFWGDYLSFSPVSAGKSSAKDKVTFGPFSPKEAKKLENEFIRVHFGFNKPLPLITSVTKTVDISHWGAAVSVNERVSLLNRAAKNDGEFNRLPHIVRKFGQQSPYILDHSLFSIDAVLPGNVENIHYRDVIGNISSSHARREAGFTIASLSPRFPLLGGWKVDFDLMYTVPFASSLGIANEIVRARGKNEFLLSVPISHPFTQVFAEKSDIRVILPSGARDIEVSFPGMNKDSNIEVSHAFGWLDTPLLGPNSGHTVLSFSVRGSHQYCANKKETVAPELFIKYTLSPMAMYRAPLLLTLYIFALFIMFVLSRRLGLQISNPKELEDLAVKNSDHDICQKISDRVTDLYAANEVLLEEMAASNNNKEIIEKTRIDYIEIHSQANTAVTDLTEEFLDEINKSTRTQKVIALLKLMKDNAMGVVDAVIANKDKSVWEAKLVETEKELDAVLEKVENCAPPTPSTVTAPSHAAAHSSRPIPSMSVPIRRRK